ncbi:hypothetical protein AAIB33_13210 [Microbacterium sp. AZCO]|uniref:hypothetical protein n=1 Tax=Microbacterium sp. AZCO TaxID=3142976 RepID=UPI0031F3E988
MADFFPPDVEQPEPDWEEYVQPPWFTPPVDEVPVPFSASQLLAATEHVAIALAGGDVYRDGVEFRIERRLRRRGLPTAEWEDLSADFMDHWPGGHRGRAGRRRYGLVLGDGERVLDDLPGLGDRDARPEGHTLMRTGGGGGGGMNSYSSTDGLWLWPAPPPGTIELVLQWPAFGIGEQRASIDAGELLVLASGVQRFWDEQA